MHDSDDDQILFNWILSWLARKRTVLVKLIPAQSHLWTQGKMSSAVGIAAALLHHFFSNNDLQKCTQSLIICFVYPVMNMNDGMNIDKRWWW